MSVVAGTGDGWGIEPFVKVFAANFGEGLANFLSFEVGKAVVGGVISDGDAFQQARDGICFAAVRMIERFVLPGAATSQDPLAGRFTVTRLSAEGIGKRQVLSDGEVRHDGIETVVQIFVPRVSGDRSNPGRAWAPGEALIGRAREVSPDDFVLSVRTLLA